MPRPNAKDRQAKEQIVAKLAVATSPFPARSFSGGSAARSRVAAAWRTRLSCTALTTSGPASERKT